MKKIMSKFFLSVLLLLAAPCVFAQRMVSNFDKDWRFSLTNDSSATAPDFNDAGWRLLDLPHDWSIEGKFNKDNPATADGGALPGGIGWYRKTFVIPRTEKNKLIYINFDGVYQKSTVWINGHKLGFRPNGYISFHYELTPYLRFGSKNTLTVKVDNSTQPNSRWYSGSGIYRNVWLVTTNKTAVEQWGTYITTPEVNEQSAKINLAVRIKNNTRPGRLEVKTTICDDHGKPVATAANNLADNELATGLLTVTQNFEVTRPVLWSVDHPYLYQAVTRLIAGGKVLDEYTTPLGIRYFDFNPDKGFSLNGKHLKILGVCDHHDLGALGAAFNYRALERQLQLLKSAGCNAIRTSHNPPAPELLELCDKMGFIVMDEAFDVWEVSKVKYDYALYFKAWHKRDLEDQLLRDRNHPSIFIWSIGNEIQQRQDTSMLRIAPDLARIVRSLDKTRPIVAANDHPDTTNQIIKSGALDLIGYNYNQFDYPTFHERYPGKKFIATETTSSLESRGYYTMPSDSLYVWPGSFKGNADTAVSGYDNIRPMWASTHEITWKAIKKADYLSGMFIWTGFDYLGEPTPYNWPQRSTFFGIFDMAGFPKDIYYMYQSELTDKPVLHIFPHWNWQAGQTVDVLAYYNHADEVELYLNGKSMGIRKKNGDDLHVMWRLKFEPGTLKAVSRKNGNIVLTQEIRTAGQPAKIELTADRNLIRADGKDLSFVTVRILDKDGNFVPHATSLVSFKINGNASIAAVDNGSPISHDPFQASYRKAYNGMALAILRSKETAGRVTFTATAEGLQPATITLQTK